MALLTNHLTIRYIRIIDAIEEERSIARPMVYVPRKSETGKRLFMLFKINEEMEHSPYRVLNANDELDMLRVRVLLSRSKEPMSASDLSHITRGMHQAAAATHNLIAQQYIKLFDQFFDYDPNDLGTPMKAKMIARP